MLIRPSRRDILKYGGACVGSGMMGSVTKAQVRRLPYPLVFGGTYTNVSTALSDASNRSFGAFAIMGNGKTLNEVRFYTSTINGTYNGNTLYAGLYSNNAAHPGTLIEEHALPDGNITGAAWRTITGFNSVMTDHTPYWILFRNSNGAPTTAYPTIRTMTSVSGLGVGGSGQATFSWCYRTASDNADPNLATWSTTNGADVGGIRLGFSDSTYMGFPIYVQAGAFKAYGGIKVGASFKCPVTANLCGLTMNVFRLGSPTGSMKFQIYQGTTMLTGGETSALTASSVHTAMLWCPLYFSSNVQVTKDITYRVVVANTASDDSSNCFAIYGAGFDTDSNSLPLAPLGGSLKYARYNGSSWDPDDNSQILPFGLLIDSYADGGATKKGAAWPF